MFIDCMLETDPSVCVEHTLHCSQITEPEEGKILMIRHPSVLNPNMYIKHLNSQLDDEIVTSRAADDASLRYAMEVLDACDMIVTLEMDPTDREMLTRDFLGDSVVSQHRASNNYLRDSRGRLTQLGELVVGSGQPADPMLAKAKFELWATWDSRFYRHAAALAAQQAAAKAIVRSNTLNEIAQKMVAADT